MARGENRIHEVELGSAPIERFRPLVGTQMWPELEGGLAGLKRRLDGHVLWNVNSTARGGGVAEMLASLVPYDRGAGIDERWAVVEGSPDFFQRHQEDPHAASRRGARRWTPHRGRAPRLRGSDRAQLGRAGSPDPPRRRRDPA